MNGASDSSVQPRTRLLAAIGAIIAVVVAAVFALVGDGTVPAADAGFIRRNGHAIVWTLLAGCLTAVAVGRGPRRLPAWLGYSALAVYVAFLATVFLRRPGVIGSTRRLRGHGRGGANAQHCRD